MTNISASLDGWQFAWQLAQREIRGSLRKFRVFLGALLLGVAAVVRGYPEITPARRQRACLLSPPG